jgi:hypothetical protein
LNIVMAHIRDARGFLWPFIDASMCLNYKLAIFRNLLACYLFTRSSSVCRSEFTSFVEAHNVLALRGASAKLGKPLLNLAMHGQREFSEKLECRIIWQRLLSPNKRTHPACRFNFCLNA